VVGLFFLIALLLPAFALIAFGLRRLYWPAAHPLARALARFGPPAEVADSIHGSIAPLRIGPIEFSGDWLVCNSATSGNVVFRKDDLLWVHKVDVSVMGTTSHRLKLYDRLGIRFEGSARPDVLERAVAAITERFPWLIVGWDERVHKQWIDDPASLVPRVEERRGELRARAQTEPGAPATGS
jgi:hypothetical protein